MDSQCKDDLITNKDRAVNKNNSNTYFSLTLVKLSPNTPKVKRQENKNNAPYKSKNKLYLINNLMYRNLNTINFNQTIKGGREDIQKNKHL